MQLPHHCLWTLHYSLRFYFFFFFLAFHFPYLHSTCYFCLCPDRWITENSHIVLHRFIKQKEKEKKKSSLLDLYCVSQSDVCGCNYASQAKRCTDQSHQPRTMAGERLWMTSALGHNNSGSYTCGVVKCVLSSVILSSHSAIPPPPLLWQPWTSLLELWITKRQDLGRAWSRTFRLPPYSLGGPVWEGTV